MADETIDAHKATAMKAINRVKEKDLPDVVTRIKEEVARLNTEKERYSQYRQSTELEEPTIEPVTNGRDSSQNLTLKLPSEFGPNTVSIQYSVTKSGMFGRKRTGTFLIFCNDDVIGSHSYSIPTVKKPLSSEDMTKIVDTIEHLVLQCGSKEEEEQKIVRAVANVVGIPQVIDSYFCRESARLCTKNYLVISDVLDDCIKGLSETTSALEAALTTLNDDHLHKFVEGEKSRTREKVELIAGTFEQDLSRYRQAVETELGERRTALEQEYRVKLGQLEDRLKGHRQKVEKDAFKIGPGMAEIFPDRTKTEWEDFNRYDQRVDAYLRKFYELRLLEDLKTVEGVMVDDALAILKNLKEVCIHRKNKASGYETREVYAGFRGVLHYIAAHEIEVPTALSRIVDTAREMNGKTPKPSVEEVLERAFPYDFNMDTHRANLHNCNTSDKKKLGLK